MAIIGFNMLPTFSLHFCVLEAEQQESLGMRLVAVQLEKAVCLTLWLPPKEAINFDAC